MVDNKIKSIFRGTVSRRIYNVTSNRNWCNDGYNNKPEIYKDIEFAKYKTLFECEIDKPPFEIGESVYINDLDLTVFIEDRVRSTNGGYIYNIDYHFDIIEDEETEKSKIDAEIKLKSALVKYNEYLEKQETENKLSDKWYWRILRFIIRIGEPYRRFNKTSI